MNISRPLAGMAAILCAAGLALTGTAGANAAEKQNTGLPDHIVNGDFSYPVWDSIPLSGVPSAWNPDFHWTSILSDTGQAYAGPMVPTDGVTAGWQAIPGFDADRFGWKSTQTDTSVDGRAPIVEIQQSHDRSNTYAEITASQAGTAIYQDISTPVPGTVYTISLKHASRTFDGHDALSVMIGAPGKETPVELTRTASDAGDPVGETSTNVESTAFAWNNEWDTYEGTYTIPAGQPITRFTFRSVRGTEGGLNESVAGNNVDDISFQVSWPLTYDLQGGTGIIPNKED